jgi:hypothetical protein
MPPLTTPFQANLGVITNPLPKMMRLVCQLMTNPIRHLHSLMAVMALLTQAMLPRKNGLAPAMVLPKMGRPIMVQTIAQTYLRHSLPRRFRVIKIAINHPNKDTFAGFSTP